MALARARDDSSLECEAAANFSQSMKKPSNKLFFSGQVRFLTPLQHTPPPIWQEVTTRTLPVDTCPHASAPRSPTSSAKQAGEVGERGARQLLYCRTPLIPLLDLLMRTEEVRVGGKHGGGQWKMVVEVVWRRWKRACWRNLGCVSGRWKVASGG